METSLTLDSDYHTNHHPVSLNADEMDDICIDQEGEWDMSLFDDLGEPESAEDLLLADRDLDLDFDLDLPVWSPDTSGGASSPYTDTEMSSGSLSPHHTTSSVTSPSSVEALSPLDRLQVEPLSPQSQASTASICSETSSFSDVVQDRKTQRRSNQASRAKTSQPIKRPIHHAPKVSIQPKPVVAFPIVHATPLQAKTIIIQPVQTVLPRDQVTPVAIRPAPLKAGAPVTLTPQAMPLPLPAPQVTPPLPVIKLGEHPVTVTTVSQDSSRPSVGVMPFPTPPPSSTGSDSISRRQQRMMKNRESASMSRKKKKEYLLTLEARLKVALFENQQLKMENGTLKKQLDSLAAENNVLKVTAPKRRAVCLMVVLMFVMLNAGSLSLFDRDPSSNLPVGTMHSGRHLLEFSGSNQGNTAPQMQKSSDRSEDSKEKALMVMKEDTLLGPPPPCQPTINRTQSIRLAHELRGWVHRHEVERTKTRRTTNSQQKNKTILKTPGEKAEVSQIVSVQYTDTLEKSSGSELQVYYARHGYYNDFFEEIHRRGDTFYVVSFRRDHLLLPATSHNKRSRPKMSVVLPAMNVNETVIKDEEYEVMMQIDCEVMDTRILRIKTSSIPPFLRTNHSDSYSAPASDKSASSVGVLTGSV